MVLRPSFYEYFLLKKISKLRREDLGIALNEKYRQGMVSSHPIGNTKCSYRSIFVAAQFAWLPVYWSEYSDRQESREYFPNCKFFQSLRIFLFRSSSSWKFREVESKFALASNAGRQIQIFPIFSQVWNWKN